MSGSNRWVGTEYREAVAGYLRDSGFVDAARSTPTAPRLSTQLREDLPDIVGVPRTALMCRTRGQDLSSPLILARSTSESHQLPYYGYVLKRRGRHVGQAYFVTDLECMVGMLRRVAAG